MPRISEDEQIQRINQDILNIKTVFSDVAQSIDFAAYYEQAGAIKSALEGRRYHGSNRFTKTISRFLGIKPGDWVMLSGRMYKISKVQEGDGKFCVEGKCGTFSPTLVPLTQKGSLDIEYNSDTSRIWKHADTKAQCDEAYKFIANQMERAIQAGAQANLN